MSINLSNLESFYSRTEKVKSNFSKYLNSAGNICEDSWQAASIAQLDAMIATVTDLLRKAKPKSKQSLTCLLTIKNLRAIKERELDIESIAAKAFSPSKEPLSTEGILEAMKPHFMEQFFSSPVITSLLLTTKTSSEAPRLEQMHIDTTDKAIHLTFASFVLKFSNLQKTLSSSTSQTSQLSIKHLETLKEAGLLEILRGHLKRDLGSDSLNIAYRFLTSRQDVEEALWVDQPFLDFPENPLFTKTINHLSTFCFLNGSEEDLAKQQLLFERMQGSFSLCPDEFTILQSACRDLFFTYKSFIDFQNLRKLQDKLCLFIENLNEDCYLSDQLTKEHLILIGQNPFQECCFDVSSCYKKARVDFTQSLTDLNAVKKALLGVSQDKKELFEEEKEYLKKVPFLEDSARSAFSKLELALELLTFESALSTLFERFDPCFENCFFTSCSNLLSEIKFIDRQRQLLQKLEAEEKEAPQEASSAEEKTETLSFIEFVQKFKEGKSSDRITLHSRVALWQTNPEERLAQSKYCQQGFKRHIIAMQHACPLEVFHLLETPFAHDYTRIREQPLLSADSLILTKGIASRLTIRNPFGGPPEILHGLLEFGIDPETHECYHFYFKRNPVLGSESEQYDLFQSSCTKLAPIDEALLDPSRRLISEKSFMPEHGNVIITQRVYSNNLVAISFQDRIKGLTLTSYAILEA